MSRLSAYLLLALLASAAICSVHARIHHDKSHDVHHEKHHELKKPVSHPNGLVSVPFLNCSGPNVYVVVNDIQANMWPPQLGQELYYQVDLTLAQEITGGSFTRRIAFSGVNIEDVEDVPLSIVVPLPIQPGQFSFNQTMPMPTSTVALSMWGFYMSIFDQNGTQQVCFAVGFTMAP